MHLQNTQHRHTGEVWMFSVWELMQTSPSPPLTCLQLSPACFCASVIDDGYFNAEQEHACEHKATFMESFFRSSVDQRSYTPESRSSDPTQSRQRPTEFVIAWKTLILLQLRLIDLNCFAVFREKISVSDMRTNCFVGSWWGFLGSGRLRSEFWSSGLTQRGCAVINEPLL